MQIGLGGNYLLRMRLCGIDIPTDPKSIREFRIVQDIDRFLPSFDIQLQDPSGIFTHQIPFDRGMSQLYVDTGLSGEEEDSNDYNFLVYRRAPEAGASSSMYYEMLGLLDTPKLFLPPYCRGWNQSIKTTLETIAVELGADETVISDSLDYACNIIQPYWTNQQLLNYLKTNLQGSGGEANFYCYIKREKSKSIFVFDHVASLINGSVKYQFVVNDTALEGYYPIYDYNLQDNYMLYGLFGAKARSNGYFDYNSSEFVETRSTIQEYLSLTDYFLVDNADSEDSNGSFCHGRSNEFTEDFKGRSKGDYFSQLTDLVKMSILTQGLPNIAPGVVVKIFFPQGVSTGNVYGYQYSGYWLVEKVIHTFGDTFRTRLLLTRNGVDTDKDTSLVVAQRKIGGVSATVGGTL